jgi:hypothetical protein
MICALVSPGNQSSYVRTYVRRSLVVINPSVPLIDKLVSLPRAPISQALESTGFTRPQDLTTCSQETRLTPSKIPSRSVSTS